MIDKKLGDLLLDIAAAKELRRQVEMIQKISRGVFLGPVKGYLKRELRIKEALSDPDLRQKYLEYYLNKNHLIDRDTIGDMLKDILDALDTEQGDTLYDIDLEDGEVVINIKHTLSEQELKNIGKIYAKQSKRKK
nr:MAG TPA: hypothetical protein [Caudoviricetes sp.]